MARIYEWRKVWQKVVAGSDVDESGKAPSPSPRRQQSVHGSFYGSAEIMGSDSEEEELRDALSDVLGGRNAMSAVLGANSLNEAAADVLLCWILDAAEGGVALKAYLKKRKGRRKTVPVVQDLLSLLRDGGCLKKLCVAAGFTGPERFLSGDQSDQNFRFMYDSCTKLGIRGEYILTRRDVGAPMLATDIRHVLLCLVVLARALQSRGVEPPSMKGAVLAVDEKGDIVLRPTSKENKRGNDSTIVDVVAHPKLEEMRMRGAFWVPDNFSDKCLICKSSFNFFIRRKHHCRSCGLLVCNSCSKHVGRCLGWEQSQRLCTVCSKTKAQRLIGNGGSTPVLSQMR